MFNLMDGGEKLISFFYELEFIRQIADVSSGSPNKSGSIGLTIKTSAA